MLTATSVHWHGMFQKNSSWSNGAAFVSQCPIVPGTFLSFGPIQNLPVYRKFLHVCFQC
jgi:FtsP/CotA-like multicopper oxidase with cupredoxin domain